MMPLQNTASVVVVKPQSLSAAGTATGIIDCLGVDSVAVDVALDSQAATSTNPAVMKLGEGDTTTAFTDITRFVGDGVGGFVIPPTVTTTSLVRLNVDVRARKRYLQLSMTNGGTACLVSATAVLGKASDSTEVRARMSGVFDG